MACRSIGLVLIGGGLLVACPAAETAESDVGSPGDAFVEVSEDTTSDRDVPTPDVEETGDPPLDTVEGPVFLTELSEPVDYGTMQNADRVIKFLLPAEGMDPRPPFTETCYFQNMTLHEWHIEFLRSFDELSDLTFDEYVERVLVRGTRWWWVGAIQTWDDVRHPWTDEPGIVSYLVYTEDVPGDLNVDEVVAIHQKLSSCAPYLAHLLVFVPSRTSQEVFLAESGDALRARGVPGMLSQDLEPDGKR